MCCDDVGGKAWLDAEVEDVARAAVSEYVVSVDDVGIVGGSSCGSEYE